MCILWFGKIVFGGYAVVVGLTGDAMLAEERCDALLLLGRDGILAFAKEIVSRCAAEDGIQPLVQFPQFSVSGPGEQCLHAVSYLHGLLRGEERAVVVLAGCRQHGDVVGDVGWCHAGNGVAQTGVLHGAVVLKTDGPFVGRK